MRKPDEEYGPEDRAENLAAIGTRYGQHFTHGKDFPARKLKGAFPQQESALLRDDTHLCFPTPVLADRFKGSGFNLLNALQFPRKRYSFV